MDFGYAQEYSRAVECFDLMVRARQERPTCYQVLNETSAHIGKAIEQVLCLMG